MKSMKFLVMLLFGYGFLQAHDRELKKDMVLLIDDVNCGIAISYGMQQEQSSPQASTQNNDRWYEERDYTGWDDRYYHVAFEQAWNRRLQEYAE